MHYFYLLIKSKIKKMRFSDLQVVITLYFQVNISNSFRLEYDRFYSKIRFKLLKPKICKNKKKFSKLQRKPGILPVIVYHSLLFRLKLGFNFVMVVSTNQVWFKSDQISKMY